MIRRRFASFSGVVAGVAVLAAAGPATAAPRTVSGTVVDHNTRAHAFVLAAPSGKLTKLYVPAKRRLPAIGRTVKVRFRPGKVVKTKLQAVSIKLGRIRRGATKVRGTVTYADPGSGSFTVSAGGASLLIKARSGKSGGRISAAAADAVPPVGNIVLVVTRVAPTGIEAEQVDDLGVDEGEIEVEGIVKSVDLATNTLVVSADDDDESGATVTITLPEAYDLSQVQVGDQVQLKLARQADGTFALLEAEVDEGDGDNNDAQQSSDGGDDS